MPTLDNKLIVVGKLASTYGIKGWLKVVSYTDPIKNILRYKPWLLNIKGKWQETTIIQGREHGKGLVVQLPGLSNPEEARLLTGTEIAIFRKQLPKAAANEYYWSDLEGLTVINQQNITLGIVKEVFTTGANDVLVVQGDKKHLLPFLPQQVILSVKLDEQIIRVDWDADF